MNPRWGHHDSEASSLCYSPKGRAMGTLLILAHERGAGQFALHAECHDARGFRG